MDLHRRRSVLVRMTPDGGGVRSRDDRPRADDRLRAANAVAAVAWACVFMLSAAACGAGHQASPAPTPAPAVTARATSPPSASPVVTPRIPAAAARTPGRPSPSANALFHAAVTTLDAATRARMTDVTWRPGCPVGLGSLRLLRLSYWGFDGKAHVGELVVNADSTRAMIIAFGGLFEARYPIRRMRPVDDYGGDDERSMLADNTSAFNCRGVPGSSAWSQHAYGRAADINPFENPEVRNGRVDPPAAAAWADRSRSDPAVIRHGDPAWRAFALAGWTWGGDWSFPKDYMHFSANGY